MRIQLLYKQTQLKVCIRRSSQYQNFNPNNDLLYEGHRSTTFLQKSLLTVGSAISALSNPLRSDMVAALGETTGYRALRRLQIQMLKDDVGCRILKEKPTIDSKKLDTTELLTLPKNTLGFAYANFMHSQGINSDTRPAVHYVDNTELAYIMKRYRQIHDFVHVLLGFSVSVPGEVIVKYFESAHFGFPMTALAAIFGPLDTSMEECKEISKFIPWALYNGAYSKLLLNVYFERELEKDFKQLKQELNIIDPPYEPF